MLLLPPRAAGEKLPEEIVRAYEPDAPSDTHLAPEDSLEAEEGTLPPDRESAGGSEWTFCDQALYYFIFYNPDLHVIIHMYFSTLELNLST